jgi:hypothetical protein
MKKKHRQDNEIRVSFWGIFFKERKQLEKLYYTM